MVQRLVGFARSCLLRRLKLERSTRTVSWIITSCHRFSTTRPRQATASSDSIAGRGLLSPDFIPPTKPPSARPVETRKSQMIRIYTSLLRTSPLILLFQHSNLTASEWAAVRRELRKAVSAVPPSSRAPGADALDIATRVQLQVLRTNMFDVALKIVEFHDPETVGTLASTSRTARGPLVHDLSQAAYDAVRAAKMPPESSYSQLESLMVGPLAALVLPAVSSAHLAAALSVLAPVPGKFPAPTRRTNPGYHDPMCQNGLAKLALIGGRIEGRIFDQSGVNWIGGIQGGLDGLRGQLVGTLEAAGLGVTTALAGGGRSIWLALEGRKSQLEEEGK